MIGRPTVAATATVHGLSVRAPQITIRAAIGRRRGAAGGTLKYCGSFKFEMRESIHSCQSCGAITNVTAEMAAVAPRAIARLRHSRRTANHRRPTPGVTLVSNTNDHVHGCEK